MIWFLLCSVDQIISSPPDSPDGDGDGDAATNTLTQRERLNFCNTNPVNISAVVDGPEWAYPDVVIVLAGGVGADGVPHEAVRRRLDAAAAIYRAPPAGRGAPALICNGGGTAHKPRFVDAAGFAVPEATLMARYLVNECGVPGDAVFPEGFSDDSIGNAFFVRAMHFQWRPLWRRIVLITSDFHAARAEAVYRWVFSLQPCPCLMIPGNFYTLRVLGTSGDCLEPEALALRREREAKSLASFTAPSGVAARVRTMASAHAWLWKEHGCYAAGSVIKEREPAAVKDAALLKSY